MVGGGGGGIGTGNSDFQVVNVAAFLVSVSMFHGTVAMVHVLHSRSLLLCAVTCYGKTWSSVPCCCCVHCHCCLFVCVSLAMFPALVLCSMFFFCAPCTYSRCVTCRCCCVHVSVFHHICVTVSYCECSMSPLLCSLLLLPYSMSVALIHLCCHVSALFPCSICICHVPLCVLHRSVTVPHHHCKVPHHWLCSIWLYLCSISGTAWCGRSCLCVPCQLPCSISMLPYSTSLLPCATPLTMFHLSVAVIHITLAMLTHATPFLPCSSSPLPWSTPLLLCFISVLPCSASLLPCSSPLLSRFTSLLPCSISLLPCSISGTAWCSSWRTRSFSSWSARRSWPSCAVCVCGSWPPTPYRTTWRRNSERPSSSRTFCRRVWGLSDF